MRHIQLRVATLNICSLRYKINDLKRLLDKEEIDIIGITETWLDSTFGNGELHIARYTLHRLDRFSRCGGGECVYCKDHIPVKQVHGLERDGLELTSGHNLPGIASHSATQNTPLLLSLCSTKLRRKMYFCHVQ